LTKERQARDAADTFRLLRAFRSIRDRAARRRIIEMIEAMADDHVPANEGMPVATDER
jgi:hypothetical protein